MNKDSFCAKISEILEMEVSENQLEDITIGQDVDSLALLELISFYEESFNMTLDPDKIEGKNLNDLYNLIK